MTLKAALIAAAAAASAVPSTVHGFCLAPTLLLCANGPHPLCTRHSVAADPSSSPPAAVHVPSTTFSGRPVLLSKGRGVAEPSNRASSVGLRLGPAGGEPDATSGRPGFGLGMKEDNDRPRVSRALNRALGNILSAGDLFGGVGSKGVSDGEHGTQCSSS